MTIQGRLKPGARPDPGSVWASPQRDIAHSLPFYVREALRRAEVVIPHGSRYRKDLLAVSVCLADFIRGTTGEGSCASVSELAEKVGLLRLPREAERVVARFLMLVVLSAYWRGARMAYSRSETPIGAAELADEVAGLLDGK